MKTKNNLKELIQKYQKQKNEIIIMDDYDAGRVNEMSHVIKELEEILQKRNGTERCNK